MIVLDFLPFFPLKGLHFMEYEYDKLFSWRLCLQVSHGKSTLPVVFFLTRRRDSFFAWPSWWSNSFRACSPAVVSLGGGWKLKGGMMGCHFFNATFPESWETVDAQQKSCAGVRNADWFSSMPSSRCSKRALKVPCGPFERPIFRRKFGCWAPKTNFPVLYTYLHLKGSNKNSSYLFIWGHLEGCFSGLNSNCVSI